MNSCKTCEYYYKEHCANGSSDYCTEMVGEDDTCKSYQIKEEVINEKRS